MISSASRLVPLTRNEIARLTAALIIQHAHDARHRLDRSTWRRRHQHTVQALSLPAPSR